MPISDQAPLTLQNCEQHCNKRETSARNRLTLFKPKSYFYTPWKRQKTFGFLTISGGIEIGYWKGLIQTYRSSHRMCSVQKGVHKSFVKFTGKLFSKRLQHRCFPVKFATFLRAPIFGNSCKRLLQYLQERCFMQSLNKKKKEKLKSLLAYPEAFLGPCQTMK